MEPKDKKELHQNDIENENFPLIDDEPETADSLDVEQTETVQEIEYHDESELYRIPFLHLIVFGLFIGLYMVIAIARVDGKYVDFGDGNYLYLSWRMTEGDVLYKDLPSPQPPLHLFLGSFLVGMAGGEAELVRLWQIIQHLLTACCVFGIARRLFGIPWLPTLAGTIYIWLPEGVWWSMGYQSEPLQILIQSFNIMLFLNMIQGRQPTLSLYGTAITSMLTCYINMTSAPYVLLQWFFVWFKHRELFVRYSLALIIPGILFFIVMWFYSAGQYIEHVFNRQVGTYPSDSLGEFLMYSLRKFMSEGGDILFYEGGFVFAAMAGIWLFANNPEPLKAKDYLVWWGLFSLGSIIFVTKGGTVEYIFTIGEPAVAVYSAYFFMTILMLGEFPEKNSGFFKNPLHLGKVVLLLTLVIPALILQPSSLLSRTLFNWTYTYEQAGANSAKVYELSYEEMVKVNRLVRLHCPENKELIAPPYYAFTAKRKLSQNSSSLFILFHAYFADFERFVEEEDYSINLPNKNEMRNPFLLPEGERAYDRNEVFELEQLFSARPELKEKYPTMAMFLAMRDDIRDRRVGLVLANIGHMFFWVPPLHLAIEEYCKPLEPALNLPTREEQIVGYIPR